MIGSLSIKQSNQVSSDYYDTSKLLRSLEIGETPVTVLSEKGTPKSLVQAPISRIDVLTESEIHEINTNSKLFKKTQKAG